ncbi:MAG: hypothetical protein BZY75_00365 [SAR202 cluster bacterium Io17-Chloro-G7]|nr:MAG: hypothetical protein BZY75_00365 [SAR202 cluster bacterium Io17-Chloro-G7]
MREVAEFVGLGPAELAVIRATAPVVLEHGEELTAAVYDHFLKFTDSRRFFLAEDGEVDEPKLERRKHSLLRWLKGSIDFKLDEDYPIRVLATGIVHSHPPLHRAHLGSIPSRYMVATISYIQTALNDIFFKEYDTAEEADRASVAWSKLLMVQLDVLLAGYMNDTPTEPEIPEAEVPKAEITESENNVAGNRVGAKTVETIN